MKRFVIALACVVLMSCASAPKPAPTPAPIVRDALGRNLGPAITVPVLPLWARIYLRVSCWLGHDH